MMAASRASRTAAALLVLAPGLAGCFQMDAVVNRDGSGSFDLAYVPGRHATIDSEMARFTSAILHVQSITPRAGGARVKATFDDVARLSTAASFGQVRIRRIGLGGAERLRVVFANPSVPRQYRRGAARITVALPGQVLSANRDAEVDGNRVTWRVPVVEFEDGTFTKLSVRYAVAS